MSLLTDRISACLSRRSLYPRPRWIGWWYWTPKESLDIIVHAMLSECRHIMRAVASSKSVIVRRLPACFRHPTASQKSVSEFMVAMQTRVVPLLEDAKSDTKYCYRDRLDNPPDDPLTEALWGILGDLIHEEALNDMYIITRIHELGIIPQSSQWYDNVIRSMQGLNGWEGVCGDSANTLYHHPMLPHPDHMIWVRDRKTATTSWASVVASPPLIVDSADGDLLIITRLIGCPDAGEPRSVERAVRTPREDRKPMMNRFDDMFERAIDMADSSYKQTDLTKECR